MPAACHRAAARGSATRRTRSIARLRTAAQVQGGSIICLEIGAPLVEKLPPAQERIVVRTDGTSPAAAIIVMTNAADTSSFR